jgi:anti-sigma regulatory factor (Ser/Thr protein kinase)
MSAAQTVDEFMPEGRHTHAVIASPAVRHVAEALDAFCGEERLPQDVAWRLRVALDEIVANIVAYGAQTAAGGTIDVWFRRCGDFVEVTVADDGPAFDPLSRAVPDVTLPLEARQPGGLGIALVRSLMDDVRYDRTTRNVLRIRKHIDDTPTVGGAGTDADRSQ